MCECVRARVRACARVRVRVCKCVRVRACVCVCNMPVVQRNTACNFDMCADGTAARRTIVVMFIGGATFAEISGLRFLSSLPSINAEFVAATTKLVNGSTLLDSYIDSAVRDALKDDTSVPS